MTHVNPTTGAPMGCEQFTELLPDYLEGELPPAAGATAEAHRLACAECAALVAELEGIRDAAAALPVLEPARDLWSGIEARIAAPVVRIDEARPSGGRAAPGAAAGAPGGSASWMRRPWLAAAAALLLVAGTAGVTYTVTASRLSGDAPDVAASAPTGAGDAPSALPAVVAAAPDEGAGARPVAAEPGPATGARAATGGQAAGVAKATLASRQPAGAGSALDVAAVYDAEIEVLRGMLTERRSALDSATVRVLETNLGIIDRAIRESREALLRDPASPLLNRQLTDALGEKLDLMRTAVLISSGAD